ncbi:hypothetical protein ACFX1S_036529 [Malus domestica]
MSFYWWRFKCALELNTSLYKNLHSIELQKSKRRLLRNRKGFAFSKAGLLRDHEGRSQESKRRLLSQRLGCSKTTKVDRRNRRGACFLKSWAAQRPRGPISEIEEAPAFSTLSAPVTCTLNFAEITGILSKISSEVESM